ncbi:fumarylacetoacetate hydrolase family protein [Streptomyces sp. NPDC051018]|uniref:fumarylacetoacetate hydrolase family protein n=1 Tax=Streptomyces sp. NPDC051018 TaxID=3365639 RepID=UPI00378EF047
MIGFLNEGERWIGELSDGAVRPVASVDSYFAATGVTHASPGPRGGRPDSILALAGLQLAPPVPLTAKVFCVGLNYREHAEETGLASGPDAPTVFGRWADTLTTHGTTVPVPPGDDGLDWEGELAAVVGRPLLNADEGEATAAIWGWTCMNDLSARRLQTATSQWTLGKNGDLTAPLGPVVVVPDDGFDYRGRRLTTRLNGDIVQDANTSQMIFTPGAVLSYISRALTIRPGDVVALGTPSGIGITRTPPLLARPGDVLEVGITGIGTLRNRIGPHSG